MSLVQRQDSTMAQWEDLISWAIDEGMPDAAKWLRGEENTISDNQYQDLCRMAVARGCYDAHDRMKRQRGVW